VPARTIHEQQTKEATMLMTIAVILGILWLVGMLTSYTVGGLLHILLVIAAILFIARLLSGRRAV
jgi:hypothetical protein